MNIAHQTQGGTKIIYIAAIDPDKCNGFNGYLVQLQGFNKPFIYDEDGVCEEANAARCDEDLNLVFE